MSAIRVLLVCESLALRGGVERFTCRLGNALAARGMSVVLGNVDTPRERVVYALDERVRVACSGASLPALPQGRGPARMLRLIAARWRVGRALARVVGTEAADVIVLNGLVTACSLLAARPGVAGRSICCDHNHFFARSSFWRALRARFYPRVAAVVSLTEADRPRFAALNANTVVIANASSLHAREPALPHEPHALAIGRHVAQKGFDLLLHAWRDVVAAEPAARLRIVGDGPLGAALRRLADELGVAGSVDFVAPAPAIEDEYRAAAVFVLSSRYEGMPLALLEAQALGVPVVAFDCPTGPGEIVTADTGVIVPAGDTRAMAEAIVALLADPARRGRMARAAIARSETWFSEQRHHDAWFALVRDVAGRVGERRP